MTLTDTSSDKAGYEYYSYRTNMYNVCMQLSTAKNILFNHFLSLTKAN